MKFTKSKIFTFCCLAFIVGVGTASFIPNQFLLKEFYYFVCAIIFLVLLTIFWERKRLRLICFIGLFLFLGFWRYSFLLPTNSFYNVWYYNTQFVELKGSIADEVEKGNNIQKIELNTGAIRGLEKDFSVQVSGKVLIITEAYPEFKYGDELKVVCELESPTNIEDFAYDRYLARYNIYSVCYFPEIYKKGENKKNWLYAKILNLKSITRNNVIHGSREPYTSIVQAIVLGDKKGIPENLRILFAQAGISHVMAISGMHIGILVIILIPSSK